MKPILNEIIAITEEVLGSPRREVSEDEWSEYNCPNCASIDGVTSDGKYNLCVNYRSGAYHCWKCQEKGRLSKVIRRWGGPNLLGRYYDEVKNIRTSKLYSLDDNEGIFADLTAEESYMMLPDHYQRLDENCGRAYRYIADRGLNAYFIERFRIGYIGWDSPNFFERNRVVIPSYDANGELNYWVGRDFTGNTKRMKYCNPQVKKTELIFNEFLVNWYEDITLVEGVFDHMVVPNSIPLLGKKMDSEHAVYKGLVERAMANVNVLLDSDAEKDAMKLYKFLDQGKLRGRIRFIECPKGDDPSSIYQRYGVRGIIAVMNAARQIDEFDLLNC